MDMRTEALTIKPGPSQGAAQPAPVGGEVLPVDKISILLSPQLLVLLLIFIPLTVLLLYKKPGILPRLVSFFRH